MRINKILMIAIFILLSKNSSIADISIPYGEGAGKVDYINSSKISKPEKIEKLDEKEEEKIIKELEEEEKEIAKENTDEPEEVEPEEEEQPELEPNDEQEDDVIPSGPLSFRIVGDNTWVADSIGGKLIQFDNKGKLISEFSILPEGIKAYEKDEDGFPISNIFIEDMAPVLGDYGAIKAWWIADSNTNLLIKFSSNGKPLALLSDPGFSHLSRVEVGPSGHLFVADDGNKKIYIYDSDGNMINEQHWEDSGMAVAGQNDYLYRLIYFNEEKKYMLVTTDVKGKVIKSKALDAEMNEPKLWWVDEVKEEAVITYTPITANENELEKEEIADIKAAELDSSKISNEEFEIVRVGFDGKVKAKGKVSAPSLMNRFIEHANYEEVYVGKCNYFEAPKGNFEIVPFKMP